jgi:hypothetical protein
MKCLRCEQELASKGISSRGLCRLHYRETCLDVASGNVTWLQLEDAGKVLLGFSKKGTTNFADFYERHLSGTSNLGARIEMNECLKCGKGLKKNTSSRGLCSQCYQAAIRFVKTGVVTWEDLEKSGCVLPSKKKAIGSAFKEFWESRKATHEPIKDMGYDFSKDKINDVVEEVITRTVEQPQQQISIEQPLQPVIGVVPPWAAK